MMKNKTFINLFLLLILLFSLPAFASSYPKVKTLLLIKIYAEPKDKSKIYKYNLTLPSNEFYSYYLGSDLPRWNFVKASTRISKFRSAELVNIRIHPNTKQKGNRSAYLTITDFENSHIIWKGELRYSTTMNNISIVKKIDNQKYSVTIKINREENTIWIEIVDR